MLALSMEQREDLLVCGGFNGVSLKDLYILNFSLVSNGKTIFSVKVAEKVDLNQG
jgi:hypothetical protein